MKREEMQSLVDNIAKERKDHIDKINNLSLKEIKQIERKSYVPRRKTKEELHKEAKAFGPSIFGALKNSSPSFLRAPFKESIVSIKSYLGICSITCDK